MARLALVAFALLWLAVGSALAGTAGAFWQLQGGAYTQEVSADFFSKYFKPTFWPDAVDRSCEPEDSSAVTTCTYYRSQADKNANINNYWTYSRLPHCQGMPAGAVASFSGSAWVCTWPPTKCEGLGQQPFANFAYETTGGRPTKVDACFDGCSVTGEAQLCGTLNGKWFCEVNSGRYTGEVCSGTEVAITPSSSNGTGTTVATLDIRPPGMCPGEINGKMVYVECSTPTSTTRTSSTTSVGSTSLTVTSDSTTVCADGKCTTTFSKTTTMASNGSVTGSTSSNTGAAVMSQDAFCKSNPSDKLCQSTVSSFSGSCQAGAFICNGDAVSCATARAVNEQKCLLVGTTDMSSVEAALTAGTFGTVSGVTRAFSTAFDQTNPYSSTCPADLTFTLMGYSSSIPLSSYCSQLQMMGNALVAFTLLAAALFVFRGSN